PKDVQALVKTAEENDYPFEILRSVLRVNERQRGILAERILEHFGGSLEGTRFAVWGLAFKPNTDDVREAPRPVNIRALAAAGAEVVAYDPEAIETTRRVLGEGNLGAGSVAYAADPYSALVRAHALVIATEWPEFRRPDFERMKRLLGAPLVFDGRNVY